MPEEAKRQIEITGGGNSEPPICRVGSGELPERSVMCCSCKQLVTRFSPALPHMFAFVCFECDQNGIQKAILESDIVNKSFAPWTAEEIASINDYQRSNSFMPFVCSEMHALIAKADGLFCSRCPTFSLKWVYPWILDASWKEIMSG